MYVYKDKVKMFDKQKMNKLTNDYLEYIKDNKVDDIKKNEIKKIYNELIYIVNFHNYLYYVYSNPIISDYEYDQLFDFLKKIEEKYPDIVRDDSPTNKLTYQVQDKFYQAEHKIPLLSLSNSYNSDDLYDWDEFVKRELKRKLNSNDNNK